MKAFLLAAGIGSRLRPITDVTPKCMLPIGGRPMLDMWLDAFAEADVDEVLVNLHYLAEIVQNHLMERTVAPVVTLSFEPQLLGSAGTLLANRQWVEDDDFFLACNADNLTDFDLRSLIDSHRENGAIATLTAFHSPNPSSGGVMEVDSDGTVIGFTEKPEHPVSDLVNAGIYAFAPDVLDEIDSGGDRPMDIGYDLLPQLVGRAHAVPIEGYFRDIGTPEAYRQAQEDWVTR